MPSRKVVKADREARGVKSTGRPRRVRTRKFVSEVTAVQVTGDNLTHVATLTNGRVRYYPLSVGFYQGRDFYRAYEGDYVLEGRFGFEVLSPETFKRFYTSAE